MLLPALSARSQILDEGYLCQVRGRLDCPQYAAAYSALKANADTLLNVRPLSVMDKETVPPSGCGRWRSRDVFNLVCVRP